MLDLSFEKAGREGSAEREGFVTDLRLALAVSLEVGVERIRIGQITKGSVQVEVYIVPAEASEGIDEQQEDGQGDGGDVERLQMELSSQILHRDSKLQNALAAQRSDLRVHTVESMRMMKELQLLLKQEHHSTQDQISLKRAWESGGESGYRRENGIENGNGMTAGPGAGATAWRGEGKLLKKVYLGKQKWKWKWRYFSLDAQGGVLHYYTMTNTAMGFERGAIPLCGADVDCPPSKHRYYFEIRCRATLPYQEPRVYRLRVGEEEAPDDSAVGGTAGGAVGGAAGGAVMSSDGQTGETYFKQWLWVLREACHSDSLSAPPPPPPIALPLLGIGAPGATDATLSGSFENRVLEFVRKVVGKTAQKERKVVLKKGDLLPTWRQARDYALVAEVEPTHLRGSSRREVKLKPGSLLMAIGRQRVLLLPYQHKMKLLETATEEREDEEENSSSSSSSSNSNRTRAASQPLTLRFFEPPEPSTGGSESMEVFSRRGKSYVPLLGKSQGMLVVCSHGRLVFLDAGFDDPQSRGTQLHSIPLAGCRVRGDSTAKGGISHGVVVECAGGAHADAGAGGDGDGDGDGNGETVTICLKARDGQHQLSWAACICIGAQVEGGCCDTLIRRERQNAALQQSSNSIAGLPGLGLAFSPAAAALSVSQQRLKAGAADGAVFGSGKRDGFIGARYTNTHNSQI